MRIISHYCKKGGILIMGLLNRIRCCTDLCRCWNRWNTERWLVPASPKPCRATSFTCSPSDILSLSFLHFSKDCKDPLAQPRVGLQASWDFWIRLLPANWTQKHHRGAKLLDLLIPSYLVLLVLTAVHLLQVCHAVKLISLAKWVWHGHPKAPSLSLALTNV